MQVQNNATPWIIKADQLIDGTGRPPLKKPAVLVRGDKIEWIGSAFDTAPVTGATLLELPGETLLPGFIDTHNHPSLKPIGSELASYMNQFRDPISRIAARSVRNLRIDLLCGVTTARVVGDLEFVDVTLAEDIQSGLIPGPRLIPSGPRLAPSGGHAWIPEWCVDGAENIRAAIRDYVGRGSRLIKLGLLDESKESTSYSDEELKAAVEEAHRLGVPVAVHCTGQWGSSIRRSLEAGVDTIEHVVPLNDEVIGWFKGSAASMSLTPFVYRMRWPQLTEYWTFQDAGAANAKQWTDYNSAASKRYLRANPGVLTDYQAYGREYFPPLIPWMSAIRRAWEKGIRLVLGSDCPHGSFCLNVEFLVDCGIPVLDAVRAATLSAARACGIASTTGSLVPGKTADLISVRGDPMKEITALRDIHLIVKAGTRFDHLSFN